MKSKSLYIYFIDLIYIYFIVLNNSAQYCSRVKYISTGKLKLLDLNFILFLQIYFLCQGIRAKKV